MKKESCKQQSNIKYANSVVYVSFTKFEFRFFSTTCLSYLNYSLHCYSTIK